MCACTLAYKKHNTHTHTRLQTLAHRYAHIIEISPMDWGVLWVVMGIIYAIYFIRPDFSAYIFAALEVSVPYACTHCILILT